MGDEVITNATPPPLTSRVKRSLGFVHDAEGKREASSDFLKLHLRDEAVLLVIVVLEHRLWKTRSERRRYVSATPNKSRSRGVGRWGGGGGGGLTKMVACGRIIKINDSYVTVSLRGCVEAALEKEKKERKRCTYIHHSLHMFADGSRVRFRSHS